METYICHRCVLWIVMQTHCKVSGSFISVLAFFLLAETSESKQNILVARKKQFQTFKKIPLFIRWHIFKFYVQVQFQDLTLFFSQGVNEEASGLPPFSFAVNVTPSPA